MKKRVLVSFLFLLVSCGQNPFINNNDLSRKIDPVTGDQEIHLSFQNPINFGKSLVGVETKFTFPVENDGDLDITKIVLFNDIPELTVSAEHCLPDLLKRHATCDFEVSFKPVEKKIYETQIAFTVSNGNTAKAYQIDLFGEGVEEASDELPNGELALSYLDGDDVSFADVYSKNKYQQLIYIKAIKNKKVKILGFRSSPVGKAAADFANVESGCIKEIASDCFLAINLLPKSLGSFKETVNIDYKIENSDKTYSLPLSVTYNVLPQTNCFDHTQEVHFAKNESELTQRERSLEYPYFDEVAGSSAYLDRVVNRATTRRIIIFNRQIYFNENTQVLMSFPVLNVGEEVYDAKILLDLLKYKEKNVLDHDTEVLCLADVKRCSGKFFVEKQFSKLINPNYKVANDIFSKRLLGEGQLRRYLINYYRYKNAYKMSDYIGIQSEELTKTVKENHTLSFVLADDSRVLNNPILITSHRNKIECSL